MKIVKRNINLKVYFFIFFRKKSIALAAPTHITNITGNIYLGCAKEKPNPKNVVMQKILTMCRGYFQDSLLRKLKIKKIEIIGSSKNISVT